MKFLYANHRNSGTTSTISEMKLHCGGRHELRTRPDAALQLGNSEDKPAMAYASLQDVRVRVMRAGGGDVNSRPGSEQISEVLFLFGRSVLA